MIHHSIFPGKIFLLIFFMCSLFFQIGLAEDVPEKIIVHPKDNGKALLNPGMGWVFHHYDNSIDGYGEWHGPNYDGREFPGLSVAYLRLAWSFLEPEEGVFNWSILDSVIQRYERMGIRFAFRFTVFEGNDAEDGVPTWLRKAGCPGVIAEPYGQKRWEVNYADPLFLEKLEHFLMAVGHRYGNNPNLDFVDIGTLGIWGEGHPVGKKYTPDVLKKHIALHKKAFPNIWIVANDDLTTHLAQSYTPEAKNDALHIILNEGLAFRDDSLNVYPQSKQPWMADMAAHFWKDRPVILEMGHYDYAKKVGAWGGELYLKAVEDYHGCYTSIHGNPIVFLDENKELIRQINLRLGYRFQLKEAIWSAKNDKKATLIFDSTWKNAGVAPSLKDQYLIWTLFNDQGDICAVFADEKSNIKGLGPNEERTFHNSFCITPKLHPGRYTVCVSLGTVSGTPKIMLPYPSCLEKKEYLREYPFGQKNEIDARRYPLGEIIIQ